MKVTGQYDSEGRDVIPFKTPVEVTQYGDRLRDRDGMTWAIRDEYGDWVSPTMHKIGVKCLMQIEHDPV